MDTTKRLAHAFSTLLSQGEERRGVEGRNDLGLLVWDKDEATTAEYSLGSRLKTPVLPIWLTLCNGHIGLLFNPNRDLMRSYHAENRRVIIILYNVQY